MKTNVKKDELIRLLKTRTVKDTAKELGVSRATIQRAIKIYGIVKNTYREVIDSIEISDEAYDLLYGSLLGDGRVSFNKGVNREAYYRAEQGFKQKDYLMHKYEVLKDICASPPKESKRDGKLWSYYMYTRCHKDITSLYSKFYDLEGNRILPLRFEKELNIRMLAYWYMDDGTLNSHSEICTQQFSPVEVGRLVATLRIKFDLECNVVNRVGKHDIQFSKEGTKSLHDLIRPFVHQSMSYKLYPCNDYVPTTK